MLAQQVMVARVDYAPGEIEILDMDKWCGYEADRRRLLAHLDDAKVKNPVVLTGDIHTNWACDLRRDFDDRKVDSVGVEFVGTSISSGGDGLNVPKNTDRLIADNPFIKFYNAERGYVRCTVTPAEWRTDYQVVEYVTRRDAPPITRASFVAYDGERKLTRA